ncbi:IS30 family transposase [Novosphingobium profundi]|uniref:IS30 family transposase n=1 Tax=Novosphingobium profundi TaxID=1774954 RepID=UPI001BDABFA8|nr:IS30 family transposase [Novosphingobium profundi]MBT0668109.1 IS30 family transposase [Novosphingobium profundi]
MGREYGQLSLEERIEIYRLHAGGRSRRSIAGQLGRAASTISRELRRNSVRTKVWAGGYKPVRAQQLAERRRRWDCRFKLARQPYLRERVRDGLAMGWSPEQIAGRLARQHGRTVISPESIYRFIYHRSASKDYWHRLLPRAKHRRGRLGLRGGSPVGFIRQRRPLAERTQEAADRRLPDHWEADYMLFARYGQSILVAHERASRFTVIVRTRDRKAPRTARHLTEILGPLPDSLRRTIAFDNGTEFARHHQLADTLGIATYFCDVRSPWQKGVVENAIGRLRRSLPRRTDLDAIDCATIQAAIDRYNSTPRKCLDFRTPEEAFSAFQSTVALQT